MSRLIISWKKNYTEEDIALLTHENIMKFEKFEKKEIIEIRPSGKSNLFT